MSKDFKKNLLNRIEKEGVSPRPKMYFRCRECFVWTFWLVSVLVGSLAVAISLFVVSHHQYAFYELTHNNYLTFLVDALPYLWLIVFGLMVIFAIYNLRHTKNGYRYSITTIVASSVLVSFASGSALHMFGLGYQIDRILGDNVDMYASQLKKETQKWQNPESGLLLGRQSYSTLSPTSTIIFADSNGKGWTVNVSELNELELALLETQARTKLIGIMSDENTMIFHACAAFPWMMDQSVSDDYLQKERDRFVRRMNQYAQEVDEIVMVEGGFALASSSIKSRSVCSRLSAVRALAN